MSDHGPDTTPSMSRSSERRRRQVWMSAIVVAVAASGIWITAATGRRDAAVLFVGLPALLALAIALAPPAKSLHGAVASITTFALLLVSILLQEGAICVLMSAPLVFAVTHAVAAMARKLERRQQGAFLLPIVLLLSLEGILPGWRIAPIHTVEASATVQADPAEVAARLAQGPDFADARKPLLLRTGMPVPGRAVGTGLEPGDRWTFDYRGAPIVTEVTSRSEAQGGGGGNVAFAVVHDGAKTARWLTWQHATLRWSGNDDGSTEVAVDITFERGLDPSWWFGPIEAGFVGAAAEYLLDALVEDRLDR